LSADEMAELIDLNNTKLEKKELIALKYIEHLTLNRGELKDPQFLDDMKELYTKKEIRFINHEWAWTNGWNWLFNKIFSLLEKLHIVSSSTIQGQGSGASCSCSVLDRKEIPRPLLESQRTTHE